MSSYDVRKNSSEDITEVVFYEDYGKENQDVANLIVKSDDYRGCVEVRDNGEFVLIESVEHARNLQKALDKAIELGWLK